MLLGKPLDGVAGRLFRLLAQLTEDFLDVLHLLPGFLLVRFKRFFDFMIKGFRLQLREHLQNLLLSAHGIRKLVHEELTWCCQWHSEKTPFRFLTFWSRDRSGVPDTDARRMPGKYETGSRRVSGTTCALPRRVVRWV